MKLISYGSLSSEVYDITKPVGENYPDVAYYIRHLSKIGGRILEAMVGTGRLLIPLLEAGLNVEGIDVSPHMLTVCKNNCEERNLNPILYEGLIENLDIPGKFSAIVVAIGSFMLLAKRSVAVEAIQAFARHLEPKGRIFIDLELRCKSFRADNTVKQYQPIHCPDGSVILMQTSSQIDWIKQIENLLIRHEKWKDGKLIDMELQSLPLHWFGLEEFIMFLRDNGYTDITVCANYTDEVEPNSSSDILCFSATPA